MIDAEVLRLRRLRDAALRIREFAFALDSGPRESNSVFSRAAVACWRMAGIATGRLRAHPHLSYQRGTSFARMVCVRVIAYVWGGLARHRGRSLRTLAAQLRYVERELNDARALTWLPELSDALGRSQVRLRRLIKDVELGAWKESGSPAEHAHDLHAAGAREDAAGVPANWPFLAL